MKVYQPYAYYDDGTNIEHGGMPEELQEFMAFPSRTDCKEWLEQNDYDPDDYSFVEVDEERIVGLILVDGYGDFVDGTGSVSAFNSGNELDRAQEKLFKAIENRIGDKECIYFNNPVTLYESKHDVLENRGYVPELTDDIRQQYPYIIGVNQEHAYDEDGTVYPISDIVDLDDIEMLYDAVVYDC